jgi:hypothetical protein
VQGAGVVAAGLMLGALAMVGPHALGAAQSPTEPDSGTGGRVIQANFVSPLGGGVGQGPASERRVGHAAACHPHPTPLAG